jgi:mono/diheme cytochrome c family protein
MRWLFRFVLFGLIAFLAIQLVPYGKNHDNPPTVQAVKWSSPEARALAVDACFACHSNLTSWPWYTNVAPISWLTARDVEDGRAKLNFSEWQRPQEVDLQEVVDAIRGQEMPPLQYRAIHPEARLSDNERRQLEQGLVKSWTADPPGA